MNQKAFVITHGDTNAKTLELNELLSKNWYVKSVHQGSPAASNYTYWLVVAEELPAK